MKKFTLFTIVALLAIAMIVPQAMAKSQATPYGRMWFDTFTIDYDKNTASANAHPGNAAFRSYSANFDEEDTTWADSGYSMFGVNFKTDCFTAKIEFNNGASASNAMDARHWYGEYNFGMGSVLIGHTWDLLFLSNIPYPSDGADHGWNHLGGTGVACAREAQIRLTFPLELGTLQLAALTPTDGASILNIAAEADTEYTLPRLEFKFATKPIGPAILILHGGYNSYNQVYNPVPNLEQTFDIDSWIYGITGMANFGPFQFWAHMSTAQNPRNFSSDIPGPNTVYRYGAYGITAGGITTIYDSELFSWSVMGVYSFNKSVKLSLFYGEDAEELAIPGTTWESDTSSYTVHLDIMVCPGFQIQPQYAYVDFGTIETNGVPGVPDAGNASKFGICWKFTF